MAQKEKFHKHPVNYAMHKARLMKERDAALTNGDEARYNKSPKTISILSILVVVTKLKMYRYTEVCGLDLAFWNITYGRHLSS